MGRSPCCQKNGLKKGPWTPEEDQKLIQYIQKNGYGNWRTLPKNAGLQRCGKSCRLRWTNYLRPDIKRGRFSFDEEETITQLHSILGNKWSAIAARLPGRTDNEIKNYWNTHIRKRLLRMGIDPVTHNPRLDLLDFSSILSSSLYNSSQMNLSRLLGAQHFVNPEILRLVAQSFQENQFTSAQVQGHEGNHVQAPIQETIPFSSSEPSNFPNFNSQTCEPNTSSNLTNFTPQNCQLNEWTTPPNYLLEDFALQNCGYLNGPQENSIYQTNDVNNFGVVSGLSTLSTPSSSPTPLDSNSTYINGTSTTTDDDRECYSSGKLFMKFEVPHMLDVNGFM